jgi:AmmeMemoRadiSam system protein A
MSKPSETSNEKDSARLTASASLRPQPPAVFSYDQRRLLLSIAHESILAAIDRRPFTDAPPASSVLTEPRGVFTTLYLDGHLRGCVGYAAPVAPLYRAIAQTAQAAAFEDSRFNPVTAEEAKRLQISLSVLSLLFPIDPEAIMPGFHGLVISEGNRRGLLLPQVPVEHGWDRETFLDQTCHKAGLPLDAWRKGATVEAFTAEAFDDDESPF